MKNAMIPNEAKMIIGTTYPPVALSAFPMMSGTKQRPTFWIQKMSEYALPRITGSMILGTEGQRAAGTRENDTPSTTIRRSARIFTSRQ